MLLGHCLAKQARTYNGAHFALLQCNFKVLKFRFFKLEPYLSSTECKDNIYKVKDSKKYQQLLTLNYSFKFYFYS